MIQNIVVPVALTAGKKVACNMGIKFDTSLVSSLVGYKVSSAISKKASEKIAKSDMYQDEKEKAANNAVVISGTGSAIVAAICTGVCCLGTQAINKSN